MYKSSQLVIVENIKLHPWDSDANANGRLCLHVVSRTLSFFHLGSRGPFRFASVTPPKKEELIVRAWEKAVQGPGNGRLRKFYYGVFPSQSYFTLIWLYSYSKVFWPTIEWFLNRTKFVTH